MLAYWYGNCTSFLLSCVCIGSEHNTHCHLWKHMFECLHSVSSFGGRALSHPHKAHNCFGGLWGSQLHIHGNSISYHTIATCSNSTNILATLCWCSCFSNFWHMLMHISKVINICKICKNIENTLHQCRFGRKAWFRLRLRLQRRLNRGLVLVLVRPCRRLSRYIRGCCLKGSRLRHICFFKTALGGPQYRGSPI